MLRYLIIAPRFHDMAPIETMRSLYDPLHGLARPHLTLVFPFESSLTAEALKAHASAALIGEAPFKLRMQGVTFHPEEEGLYLFLRVTKGEEAIRRISQRLYEGALAAHRSSQYDTSYLPHLTLGKVRDKTLWPAAMADGERFAHAFETLVSAVEIEAIGPDGASILECVVPLSGR